MKRLILSACCALATILWSVSAQAQNPFPYTGGTLNTNVVYAGLGVNASQNPLTIGAPGSLVDDYMSSGTGDAGSLTVLNGTLTINDDDLKIAASGGNGTLILGTNATLNVNNIGTWGFGIDNNIGAHGTLTISNNAVLNLYIDGTSQQRLVMGNNANDVGIINMDGGMFNVSTTNESAITDAGACWGVGWNDDGGSDVNDGTGTINLNAGAINDNMPLPFVLGGGYGTVTTIPVIQASTTVNVMNISNGVFAMTQIFTNDPVYTNQASFNVTTPSYVNFIPGGTGSLSLTNWSSANYETLVASNLIYVGGAPAPWADFKYSSVNGMGNLQLGPVVLVGPTISTPEYGYNTNVIHSGEFLQLSVVLYDTNTPTYQWQVMNEANPGTFTNLPNGTGTNVVINTLPFSDGNNSSPWIFQVVVNDGVNPPVTNTAAVTILPAQGPKVTQDVPGTAIVISVGQTVTLPVTLSGNLPMYFQWVFNSQSPYGPFTNLLTQTNNVLKILNANTNETGYYQLIASNSVAGGETAQSSVQPIIVNPLVPIPPLPGSYGQLVVTNGANNNLVAFWQLNETSNPTAGGGYTEALDYSGNGHTGTYGVAALNESSGIFGPTNYPGFATNQGALETTPGIPSSVVTCPDLDLPTNTVNVNVTISMWIDPLTTPTVDAGLFYNRGGGTGGAAGFGFANDQGQLGYNWDNTAGSYNYNSGLTPPTNTWSFVSLVVTTNSATIYLCYINTNGAPVYQYAVNNTAATPYAFIGGTTVIGQDTYATTRVFGGIISDVAVYDSAFSPQQILQSFGKGVNIAAFAPQISGLSPSVYYPAPLPPGQNVALSASSFGTTPVTNQWILNNVNLTDGGQITGSATASLTVSNLTYNNVGSYQLVVSNVVGVATSSVVNVSVLPATLVGEWLSGGQTYADVSGYSPAGTHDAYPTNASGLTWSSDVPSVAPANSASLEFSGAGLIISNSSTLDAAYTNTFDDQIHNGMTVMCWSKGFPGGWNPWVSKYGEGPGWQLRVDGSGAGNIYACWSVRGTGGNGNLGASVYGNAEDMATRSVPSNDGNWHHYAGTYSPITGIRSLYIDGKLAAEESGNGPYSLASAEHLCIGAKDSPPGNNFGNYYSGEIYDVRVYNYALPENQIVAIVNGTNVAPNQVYVTPGAAATFTTPGIDAAPPFTGYRWTLNGANLTDGATISGSSTLGLTVTNATSLNQGLYQLLVTNAAGVTTDSVVNVTYVPATEVGAWLSEGTNLTDISGYQPAAIAAINKSYGPIGWPLAARCHAVPPHPARQRHPAARTHTLPASPRPTVDWWHDTRDHFGKHRTIIRQERPGTIRFRWLVVA